MIIFVYAVCMRMRQHAPVTNICIGACCTATRRLALLVIITVITISTTSHYYCYDY